MPTEFLTGMQLGSTMAARAQDMRANALNMTQRLMQMDQQAQMFPLELQQLNNRNQVETLNIQAANEAMSAKHADDLAWADWHTKHTNALDLLTSPPSANTMDGMKRIAQAQKIVGDTVAGMELVAAQQAQNPLIQARIASYRASEAASRAREEAAMKSSLSGGGKDYGEPVVREIAPGITGVWRPGSPGIHIVDKKTGNPLTVTQRIALAGHIATIKKQMADMDKNDPDYAFLQELLRTTEREASNAPAGLPAVSPKTETPPNPKDPLGLFK